MAELDLDNLPARFARRRYPWQHWEAGGVHRVRDVDRTLAGVLRTRAARKGSKVRTRRIGDDGDQLLFQFLPPDKADASPEDGGFAPVFDSVVAFEVGDEACPRCGNTVIVPRPPGSGPKAPPLEPETPEDQP